jgi:uncharacterized repeat protein (TIGR03837 family)
LVAETLSAVALWGGAGGALSLKTADIFCRVIDNFGDAGVAWRLGAQLALEHDFLVRIFIDLPDVLAQIAPQVLSAAHPKIQYWNDADHAVPAELVLSTFCCRVPEAYIKAMHAQPKKPVWINVEYLSAEPWVETYHKLPSLRPDGLIEYFFYPGFTEKTGGLLREYDVRNRMESAKTAPQVLSNAPFTVSVFCYETPSLAALIDGMNDVGTLAHLLIPEGRVSAQLGLTSAHATRTQGCVTLEAIPFTDQAGYDQLLARCDFNIVRGEDSFVRAQWAAKPFLWHIYPQAENAHVAKLQAWLERFQSEIPAAQFRHEIGCFFHAWNAGDTAIIRAQWPLIFAYRSVWKSVCYAWRIRLYREPDLVSRLLTLKSDLLMLKVRRLHNDL